MSRRQINKEIGGDLGLENEDKFIHKKEEGKHRLGWRNRKVERSIKQNHVRQPRSDKVISWGRFAVWFPRSHCEDCQSYQKWRKGTSNTAEGLRESGQYPFSKKAIGIVAWIPQHCSAAQDQRKQRAGPHEWHTLYSAEGTFVVSALWWLGQFGWEWIWLHS